MKDIGLLIREKEVELERVKVQLIALRYVAPLLFEEGVDNMNSPASMTAAAGASSEGKTRGWP